MKREGAKFFQLSESKQKFLQKVVLVGVMLITIKGIVAHLDIDGEYAIAMSWRMLQGDRMFLEMWEPHQTSAFLMTGLMWIFVQVTGGVTGIALFLNSIGACIYAVIARMIYKTILTLKPTNQPTTGILFSYFLLFECTEGLLFA